MSERTATLKLIAKRFALPLSLALITIFGVHEYLQNKSQALDQKTKQSMVPRVVASVDLPKGTHLSFDHLSVRELPRAWVGPDSYDPEQAAILDGMLLTRRLSAGQPIVESAITSPQPPALSKQLEPGRRAITIPVNYVSSVSGRLEAGDLIDVYVTFMHAGQRVTTLLVSSVKILMTDKSLGDNGFESSQATVSAVTLDVSASQAAKLIAANQDGVLTAVLRLNDETSDSSRSRQNGPFGHANHLAGFVGLSPSYGEATSPLIIYGDAAVDHAQDIP